MAHLIPENLKSRRDVPPGAQRVARALESALSGACSIWYEPLYDPAQERPHFIVLVPESGIAVFEVLEFEPEQRFLGFLHGEARLLRDGVEVSLANPLERAERLAEGLTARLQDQPRLRGRKVRLEAGAILVSLTRDDAAAKGAFRHLAAERCLTASELEEGPSIRGFFARFFGQPDAAPVPEGLEAILRGVIQPDTVIEKLAPEDARGAMFRPSEDDEEIVRVMDVQQENLAKTMGGGHRVLRGVAGSGKTLVLLARARLWSRLRPAERFLVTCFTKTLAAQLRLLLADCANVEVEHLDRLMAKAIRAAGFEHPGYESGGDTVASAARAALEAAPAFRYDGLLADEAQDFGTPALEFLVRLLAPGKEDLLVVADAAQNIFRRRFSWKQAGIQAQGKSRIFRVNYRNTREILDLANGILSPEETGPAAVADDENAVVTAEKACRSGPRPIVRLASDVRSEAIAAAELVRGWLRPGAAPLEIALLYGAALDCGVDRPALVCRELRRHGAGVFWTHEGPDREAKERLAQTHASVVMTTIQSAKGLEFPCVVLFGLRPDGDLEEDRRLLYVGMTRATKLLAVVTRQGHPLAAELKRLSSWPSPDSRTARVLS